MIWLLAIIALLVVALIWQVADSARSVRRMQIELYDRLFGNLGEIGRQLGKIEEMLRSSADYRARRADETQPDRVDPKI
ncbi:hypothetical protein [Allosphingosinicella indica]|nr:hypothetical protein [Allosphingosinicella indica]